MRVDKFLWSIRYYKTRNLAADACKKNKIWINSVLVKASKEVIISDSVKIRKDQVNYTVDVIQIPKSRVSAKALSLYIVDKTDKAELEAQKLLKESQEYYRASGLGRPSKKDRREIDGLFNSAEKGEEE